MRKVIQALLSLITAFALNGCIQSPDYQKSQSKQLASNVNLVNQRPNCDVPEPPPVCDGGEPGDPPTPVNPGGVLNAVNVERQEIFILSNGNQFKIPAIARFSGWARDKDSGGSIKVRLTHNGSALKEIDANQAGSGALSGHYFADAISWTPVVGTNTFCAVAVNVGPGEDKLLGCQTYEVDSPPTIPAILSLGRAGINISIRWQDRSDNEQHFFVDRYIPGGGYFVAASVTAIPGTNTITTTNDATTLPDDLRCFRMQVLSIYYRVFGADACLPNTVPSAPVITDLLPTASNMSIWFTLDYDNATGFRFERRPPTGTWSNANLEVTAHAGASRAALDISLEPQSVYCYRVVAINRFGESPGGEACKKTLRKALPTPSELRVTATDTSSLTLAWTDNAVDETYYQVIYRVVGANNSEPIINMPANPGTGPMSQKLIGLRADTEYCFSVMARAPDAEERNAATLCARTAQPLLIKTFDASPAVIQFCAPQQITLSWAIGAASRITISRNGTEILARDNPSGTSNWQERFVDPEAQDGTSNDISYNLQAFSNSGTTTSKQILVASRSAFPAISAILFVNNSSRNVMMQRLTQSGLWSDVQLVESGHYYPEKIDHCSTALYRAVDISDPTYIPWQMTGIVIGFPTAPLFNAVIN